MIWVGTLICWAIILQTIEFFWLPPWNWNWVQSEMPRILKPLLRFYRSILVIRLVGAVAALFFPSVFIVGILLATTWLIAIRWRGTFNGGSDAMTFQILAAWLMSLCFPQITSICVFYIGVQLILSYFVAGIAKLRNSDWRRGLALRQFLGASGIQISESSALTLSWVVILFECLFPMAALVPVVFLPLAFVFHLANVYVFGLNRFLFAWLAAYPALIALSKAYRF